MYKKNFQSVIVNNKLIAGGKQGGKLATISHGINADGGHKFE